MAHVNIEIKARCSNPQKIRDFLRASGAVFKGVDHQTDTYFQVPAGRLKLRQGTLENALIYYRRPDQKGPKRADVSLYHTTSDSNLAEVLAGALDISVIVKKEREIYFLDNVKFHIDSIEGLGNFLEIEAIDADKAIGIDKLRQQCDFYRTQLGIEPDDLVDCSYSDMLLLKEIL